MNLIEWQRQFPSVLWHRHQFGDYDNSFRDTYRVIPSSSYNVVARAEEGSFDFDSIRTCIYRPFDFRFIYYQLGFTSRPVFEVQGHMLHFNLALLSARQSKEPFAILATRYLSTHKIVTVYDRTSIFPLYLYPTSGDTRQKSLSSADWPPGKDGRVPNLSPEFVADFAGKLGLSFVPDGRGDREATFGPEDA